MEGKEPKRRQRNRDPEIHTPTNLIKTLGGSHGTYAENLVQTHAGPVCTALVSEFLCAVPC